MNGPVNRHLFAFVPILLGAAGANAQIFFDDFDSYKTGSSIAGQGGWDVWCDPPGLDATLSDAFANSKPNSLRDTPGSDIVQELNETSGQLVFSFMVYVPSGATGGSGSINLMKSYCPNTIAWGASTTFSPDAGLVQAYLGGSTPLILDQWVQYRCEIDLDNDSFDEFYGGTQFTFDVTWTTNVGAGPLALVAADFFNDTLTEIFFDDVSLESAGPGCYPDCDGNGALDLFDFLCFVNDFNTAGDYSDCDGNGAHDLFDFLCFVNAFNASC